MSRSYHITRKQADKAMNAGDLDTTWEASEKAWVKKAAERKRVLGKALKSRPTVPNRAIVAEEKRRTSRFKVKGADLYGRLESMIKKAEKAGPCAPRNAAPPHR